MVRLLLSLSLLFLPARPSLAITSTATNDPLFVTLQEVKAAYAAKKYEDADGALRRLSELIAAPEREPMRPRILPAYHFYAAAVAYARHEEDRARTEMRRFFDYQPDASIDPAIYPKSFRIFFEAQKNEKAKLGVAEAPPPGPQATEGGLLPNFATSDFDEAAIPAETGAPEWIETAVKFLLSDADRREWRTLADDEARREFITRFWKRYEAGDPNFRTEFYRRLQYADANFSTERTRGSLTDRGMVFLILGPASYVGRAPLLRSQDVMNYLRTTEVIIVTPQAGGGALQRVPSNRSQVTPGDIEGEVETWYYRRDRLPKGIGFQELQYQFVSRQGYGSAVLQKEARELNALGKAAQLLKKG